MIAQPYFTDIKPKIVGLLSDADTSIYACIAWVTDSDLFGLLCRKAKSGCDVRLMVVDDSINEKLHLRSLDLDGGKLYKVDGSLMHNKFCVIDRRVVITGSYNWTYSASTARQDENITVIEDEGGFAEQYISEFERIVKRRLGEYESLAANFDLSKVSKRLEVIRQLIELEDTEDIALQIRRLQQYALPDTVQDILRQLQAKAYGGAVTQITQYLKSHRQVTTYTDPEISGLKLEIKTLELELASLSNELSTAEKLIHDFSIRHNRILGDLIRRILALRLQVAQDEAQGSPQQQSRYEEAQKDYENYNSNYESLQKETLHTLTSEEARHLKSTFRKAALLCHPDKVNDSQRPQAQAAFVALQKAYKENNLARVQEIWATLKQGNIFVGKAEGISEKAQLKAELLQMREVHNQILHTLNDLKASDAFQTILNITDWAAYFEETKGELEEVLEELESPDELPF